MSRADGESVGCVWYASGVAESGSSNYVHSYTIRLAELVVYLVGLLCRRLVLWVLQTMIYT